MGKKSATGKTRRKAKAVATSIPELKRSFDALEHAVSSILSASPSPKQRVKRFQEAWRRIFGRPVEAAAAEAYLQVKSRGHRGKTRKAQAGGAALAGAPLDFQTRPGVDGVHGSFPGYVNSGLGFYNTINQDSLFKSCGVQDITPKVPVSIGSNEFQKGGGILTTISDAIFSSTTRPVNSSMPPSVASDLQNYLQGRPAMPSPAPEQNPKLLI